MSRIPKNLQGLYRFCLEAGSDLPSEREPMNPQDAEWLREALKSMTVDLADEMRKRISTIIEAISSSNLQDHTEEVTSALDDLIDLAEDVNLAVIFLKIDGLELLKTLLELPSGDFYAQTGMLLSNIVQNDSASQNTAITGGLLKISLELLSKENDSENMRALLSAISSMVRGNEFGQKQFLEMGGFECLFEILEKANQPETPQSCGRFIEKASFFIFCLCQELYDENLETLKEFRLSERIARLILNYPTPSEFLIKALALLLNGRISTLIDPSSDSTQTVSSPVKLALSEETRNELKIWLNSVNCPNQKLYLDAEIRQELEKALK